MEIYQLESLKDMARGINSVFGDRCEVAIHDFSDFKNSLVYLVGNVTNRSLGSPIPDMLYRLLKEFGDEAPNKLGYKSTTDDGRVLKCATIMFRNDEGKIVGCLCINFNVSDFAFLATAFSDFTFIPQESVGQDSRATENGMSASFGETMESIIDFAVADYGKIPSMMNKSDRVSILQKLDKDDVFMIKGSVEYISRVLGSSRYTIYNYLKQIRS